MHLRVLKRWLVLGLLLVVVIPVGRYAWDLATGKHRIVLTYQKPQP